METPKKTVKQKFWIAIYPNEEEKDVLHRVAVEATPIKIDGHNCFYWFDPVYKRYSMCHVRTGGAICHTDKLRELFSKAAAILEKHPDFDTNKGIRHPDVQEYEQVPATEYFGMKGEG